MNEGLLNLLFAGLSRKAKGDGKGARVELDPVAMLLALLLEARGLGSGDRGQGSGDREHRSGGRLPPSKKKDPERERKRDMIVRDYARDYYAPAGRHDSNAARDFSRWAINRLDELVRPGIRLRECTADMLDDFRDGLQKIVQAGALKAATANRHLRQLRAVVNFAARRRLVKRLPPLDWLEENRDPASSWTPQDLARLEDRARSLGGAVDGCPACLWWTSWHLVISRLGCRPAAQMACRWRDFCPDQSALLLRAETQKQKKSQRFWLPVECCAALEELRSRQSLFPPEPGDLIWPWPHDSAKSNRKRKFKCLEAHWKRFLVAPAGLILAKGVAFRQYRRTAATLRRDQGGDAQALLGHSSPRVTEIYLDPAHIPVCREAVRIERKMGRQETGDRGLGIRD